MKQKEPKVGCKVVEFKILHIAVEKYQMSWCLKLPKSCVHFFFDFMRVITVSLMIEIGEARHAVVFKAYKALFSKIC